MKKFIIIACIVVLLFFIGYSASYRLGIYIDLRPNALVDTMVRTSEQSVTIRQDGEYQPFEIRGVDLGDGIPGKWSTDFEIDEETYLRWFAQIQELGANTVRVHTVPGDAFYRAFYEYNQGRQEPLYLLQGVWVNDYMINSHRDAYEDIMDDLQKDCRIAVDVIHGRRKTYMDNGGGEGNYDKDVSPWVIGYIVGGEWETGLVVYTNQLHEGEAGYDGKYLYTKEEASPFETMLCRVGDKMLAYESKRYKTQRMLAFDNSAITDPFLYHPVIVNYYKKWACVDMEHIGWKNSFLSGMFASYHVYSFFPDYVGSMREISQYSDEEIEIRLGVTKKNLLEYRIAASPGVRIEEYLPNEEYLDENGDFDSYLPYLKALTAYHTIPVVISQYGAASSRGVSESNGQTRHRKGHMTEKEQGEEIIHCYKDIMEAGCAGSCLFSWQDDWGERTWNTMYAVDRDTTPYWSDYQTTEQFFGLLTFDPGEETCVCYVDGMDSEWEQEDLICAVDDGTELSMKYDEKFVYFMVQGSSLDPEKEVIYIPIDTTPKSGSTYCENYEISFERDSDFLLMINGKENSRLMVQKYYEALLARYGHELYNMDPYVDTPERKTPYFENIYMAAALDKVLPPKDDSEQSSVLVETGKLRCGIANPGMEGFDSLADFAFGNHMVEIRIPWQMLNFSNPSEMMIHDDYYEKYGIENLQIDKMYVGVGLKSAPVHRIPMHSFALDGWNEDVTSHERLKQSYYILQDYWKQH